MMASALAENGAKVYIVGRRQEKLNEAVARFGELLSSGEGVRRPGADGDGAAASKRGTGKLVAYESSLTL